MAIVRQRSFVVMFVLVLVVLAGFSRPATAAVHRSQTFTVVLPGASVSQKALALIESAGGVVVQRLDKIGVIQVRAEQPGAFLDRVLGNSLIAHIGPSLKVNAPSRMTKQAPSGLDDLRLPNLTDYTWGIDRVTDNGAAWDIHLGTHDVIVGVIDTGFDFDHPDLKANIVPGSKTFVPGTTDAWDAHFHGTHVAGTIAANGGIKGVAPNVGLRAYRVFDTGSAEGIWIINAILAAADDRVDVINMSLGGGYVGGQVFYTDPATGKRYALGNDNAERVAYGRALKYAADRNVTAVVSAGNDELNLSNKTNLTAFYNAWLQEIGLGDYQFVGATFMLPAQFPGVVTVSATGGGFGTQDRLAFYSNYGSGVINVAAPGGDLGPEFPGYFADDAYKYLVLSTYPTYLPCWPEEEELFNCEYAWAAGTSMAAPHVSGVAALIISQEYARTGVKPSPAQVITKLQQSAEDIGKVGYDNLYGHGLTNAYNALSR